MDGEEFIERYPLVPDGCTRDNYKSFLNKDKGFRETDLNELMVIIQHVLFKAMDGIDANTEYIRSIIDENKKNFQYIYPAITANTTNLQAILHDVYGGAPPVAQSKKSKRRRSQKKRKSRKSRKSQKSQRRR